MIVLFLSGLLCLCIFAHFQNKVNIRISKGVIAQMQYIFKGYWKLSFEELEQKNFLQKIGFLSCIVGWSDFEREKMLNFLHYAVPNCCRTPIPKLHAFSLVTGTRKIFTVTLKRAIFITFLKGSPETNLFFALFKSENWRETPKLFFKTIF